ncbi:MAG: DNA internalization-related competence protein ComEC/Rec2 [Bacillota bacterium]|nr:DNA internalization-related competence protein ComEC/Rec2 [Bacillota bacterium]
MRGVRKLAAVCVGFSAAVFAAHYLLSPDMLISAAAVCAAMGILGFAFRKNTRLRIVLLFFAAAVGFLGYKYNVDTFLAPCEEMADREVTLNAVVTAYPEERKSCTLLYVRFCDDALPKTDGVLFDYSGSAASLCPGDEIRVDVKLRSAQTRYGEETDINISKGLCAVGYINGECRVTDHKNVSLMYLPKQIGHALGEKIREIFPESSEGFMLALLTGDRTDYYGDGKLSSSMSTAGLAHVVAVSGMHVAFLVGFLMAAMGRNRRSALMSIALVWAFVIMVGAPPSSVRAAVMQTMLLAAYLFRREYDNITVLSFAMAVILALNPFACGSISFQLSFGAMAGIMLFTQPLYVWLVEKVLVVRGRLRRLWDYLAGVLASSVAATVFTVPLIAAHFGYVSVLSPLANILCLWCISLLFCGGYVICAIGYIVPAVAKILAWIISYLVQYIALVVKWIADIPFSAVYVENKLTVLWLAASYAAFAAFLLLKRKHKISALIPIGVTVLGFAALIISLRISAANDPGTISIMDVGSGQCIAITSGNNAVAVDCGRGSISENPGDMLSSYLHANGRSYVDAVVLTHLHKDHANGVCKLLNSIEVGMLILPSEADEENGLLEEILAAADENNVSVAFIDRDCSYCFGEISLELYALEANSGALMLTADIGDYTMLVAGDAEKKAELELAEREDLSETDLLVVGHHGSKYSSCEEFLDEVNPEIAVISVGYNSYGHPTQEVLDRLEETEAEVYRTDLDGRFLLRLK